MKILITGCCGFIGFSLAKKLLLNKKNIIIGIDCLDRYYDVSLKKNRLKSLIKNDNFKFFKFNLKDKKKIDRVFDAQKINIVFHFAAQAGVRFSFSNPFKYIDDNFLSFMNILENIKKNRIKKFFFASSSSVYGDTKKIPSKEHDNLNEKNLYALSKTFNEKISQVYSEKYDLNICGLRFFTVYGEWGRPDMFMMKYINASIKKNFFYLYNYGKHKRDFTYIDDVTFFMEKIINNKRLKKFSIINISSSRPYSLYKVMNEINLYFKAPKIIKKKGIVQTF
tara:strand:+ start:1092 stop:1931 length:840 start_codon:yes stop_codon:yes gene_type:complete